jgi:hypothetical protein
MGPAFAAPGVAVEQVARSAIAEAIAIIEIVFMLVSNSQAAHLHMLSRTCGCDYKKSHTGLLASSRSDAR